MVPRVPLRDGKSALIEVSRINVPTLFSGVKVNRVSPIPREETHEALQGPPSLHCQLHTPCDLRLLPLFNELVLNSVSLGGFGE